jgi:deoxyribose-phosphate aldolase
MPSRTPKAAHARLLDEIGSVDQVGIEERVAKFTTRSIKKTAKVWGLRMAVSMTDLTTLEGKDTPGKIESLCQKALHPHDDPSVPDGGRRLRLPRRWCARRRRSSAARR